MQVTAYSVQNRNSFFHPPVKPFIVGVCGGSSSGKTTLAKKIKKLLGDQTSILHQDSYYKDQSEKLKTDQFAVNFDHPSAIDFKLLKEHLQLVKKGATLNVPVYDFATHSRLSRAEIFIPTEIIILEGFLILNQNEIRKELDYSIFMEIDFETRLSRRINRDLLERGRDIEGVKHQFLTQVEPMHQLFVEPSKIYANGIIHHHENEVEILGKLYERLQIHFEEQIKEENFSQFPLVDFHKHLRGYQSRV